MFMTPKTNYVYLSGHKDTPNNSKKSQAILTNTIWGNLKISKIETLWKGQAPTNHETPT